MKKLNCITPFVLPFFLWNNRKRHLNLSIILFFIYSSANCQIANYVSNGGFEECLNCDQNFYTTIPAYWSSIDTNNFFGQLLTKLPPTGMVPLSSYTYQWPVHGNNYFITGHYLIPAFATQTITRGYPRNRLKGILQIGHIYCVKFYYNISNQSTHGISSVGAYFGNSSIDTITKCETPITYLTPQIVNPAANTITDTLNWLLMNGTFVANGTEKYMVLGNFKSDANSGAVLINPANLPLQFCDVLYDDVSVIDIDLPAYAGPDIFGIPNNTVYIGRPQDVGIDEACMWYHLPNITTAIDTAAGITVTVGVTTSTYVVRQEICGNVKWDTVRVFASGLGLNELIINNEKLKIYPNPANDLLNIQFTLEGLDKEFIKAEIINGIGQVIKEADLNYNEKLSVININELPDGFYLLNLKSNNLTTVSRRFIISR